MSLHRVGYFKTKKTQKEQMLLMCFLCSVSCVDQATCDRGLTVVVAATAIACSRYLAS